MSEMQLSPDQQAAYEFVLSNYSARKHVAMGGYAGSGKTTLIRKFAERWPTFQVCAPTGKAADVLRRRGLDACTIHSAIYKFEQVSKGKLVFSLKPSSLVAFRGLIVDEASMVSRDIYQDIMSFGFPVIFVGDHGQLPPVGDDAKLMANPDVKLEKLHRNAGPIARFAEHLRKGGTAREWHREHKNNDGQVEIMHQSNLKDNDYLDADQIICAMNNTRVSINKRIRQVKGYDDNVPVDGDRIMCLKNSRELGVFNGQQGIAQDVDSQWNDMTFVPDHGSEVQVSFDPKSFNAEKQPQHKIGDPLPFDYAWAITCHKSQGDQFRKLLVVEQKCKMWDHSRWAYTAASRAIDSLKWAAE